MSFNGFPVAALDFYDDLEMDNTKSFWEANKAVYAESVAAPMKALTATLEPEFGPPKVFRPYRDVRFAKDKTPYKDNIAAVTETEGGVAHYLALSPDGLFVGGGMHHMAADQLERFRQAIDSDASGAALEDVVTRLERSGLLIGGEALKRAPRGFDPAHPRIRLLRHKGLTAGRQWPPAKWLHTRATLDRVRKAWDEVQPLVDWLDGHVGASTLPPPEPR